MSILPNRKTPCKNCPFRKDTLKGWLGAERMKGIIQQRSFVCHKTTQKEMKDRLQCAGHMILMGEDNGFVSLAKLFGHDTQLKGQDLIFDSKEDCIDHHKN